MPKDKSNILILCTANSCRSQMSEGIARQLFGDQYNVYSAGSKPSFVHPKAIAVMKEINIDISTHHSKSIQDLDHLDFDVVMTVCGHADDNCPVFQGSYQRVFWPFEDPASADHLPDADAMDVFRNVRDQILTKFKQEWHLVV